MSHSPPPVHQHQHAPSNDKHCQPIIGPQLLAAQKSSFGDDDADEGNNNNNSADGGKGRKTKKRKQYTFRQKIDIMEQRDNSDVLGQTKNGWDYHFALAAVNLGYGDNIKLVRTLCIICYLNQSMCVLA